MQALISKSESKKIRRKLLPCGVTYVPFGIKMSGTSEAQGHFSRLKRLRHCASAVRIFYFDRENPTFERTTMRSL